MSIRDAFSIMATLVQIIVGTGLLLYSTASFGFSAGLGLVMYGQALRRVALDRAYKRIRRRIGLSMERGLQLWCAVYVAAGFLFFIAAVTTLQPAFATIIAFAAFCWIWIWGWLLRQSRKWVEPLTADITPLTDKSK